MSDGLIRGPVKSVRDRILKGMKVRFIGDVRGGPGTLIDIIPAGMAIDNELAERWYGERAFSEARPKKVDRYVFQRDDSGGFVIVGQYILHKCVVKVADE